METQPLSQAYLTTKLPNTSLLSTGQLPWVQVEQSEETKPKMWETQAEEDPLAQEAIHNLTPERMVLGEGRTEGTASWVSMCQARRPQRGRQGTGRCACGAAASIPLSGLPSPHSFIFHSLFFPLCLFLSAWHMPTQTWLFPFSAVRLSLELLTLLLPATDSRGLWLHRPWVYVTYQVWVYVIAS